MAGVAISLLVMNRQLNQESAIFCFSGLFLASKGSYYSELTLSLRFILHVLHLFSEWECYMYVYIFVKGENLRHDHVLMTVNIISIKENNLRPDKKISYISGLTRPISMP